MQRSGPRDRHNRQGMGSDGVQGSPSSLDGCCVAAVRPVASGFLYLLLTESADIAYALCGSEGGGSGKGFLIGGGLTGGHHSSRQSEMIVPYCKGSSAQ